jgi:hypothetical protein
MQRGTALSCSAGKKKTYSNTNFLCVVLFPPIPHGMIYDIVFATCVVAPDPVPIPFSSRPMIREKRCDDCKAIE